ncbi:MAG: SprB repeat-containing protein, partial [Salinivirgaceae bacterium]|nr:SprB repeat-containing protein [Salinivirgaceae bacterium]
MKNIVLSIFVAGFLFSIPSNLFGQFSQVSSTTNNCSGQLEIDPDPTANKAEIINSNVIGLNENYTLQIVIPEASQINFSFDGSGAPGDDDIKNDFLKIYQGDTTSNYDTTFTNDNDLKNKTFSISGGIATVVFQNRNDQESNFDLIWEGVLNYTANIIDDSCFQSGKGAIDFEVLGTSDTTISWSSTNNFTYNNEDIRGLKKGDYTIDVTTNNGCTLNQTFTIDEAPALLLDSTHISDYGNSNEISCKNANNGWISLFVSGGTQPYNYSWDNGQKADSISGLAPNTYNVNITDINGCPETGGPFELTEPSAISVLAFDIDSVNCFSDSTGTINISNITGGTQPFSFSWIAEGTSDTFANNDTITDLYADNYTVTISDANSCSATKTFTVKEPVSRPTVNFIDTSNYNGFGVKCFNSNEGFLKAQGTGGTAPYNYLWSRLSGGFSPNTALVSNLIADTYTVNITDHRGCSVDSSIIITQPAASVTLDSTHISDYGNSNEISCKNANNGWISVFVSGGTQPYNYSWDNGLKADSISGLAPNTYNVNITDINGCPE